MLLGVLLAELYVSTAGIGYFTQLFTQAFEPTKLLGLVSVLAAMAIALNEIVRRAEGSFRPLADGLEGSLGLKRLRRAGFTSPMGEVGCEAIREGLRPIESPSPLTPTLSPTGEGVRCRCRRRFDQTTQPTAP